MWGYSSGAPRADKKGPSRLCVGVLGARGANLGDLGPHLAILWGFEQGLCLPSLGEWFLVFPP